MHHLPNRPQKRVYGSTIDRAIGFQNSVTTVLVIEHNLDVLKCADWIIDLGPEGGEGGGRIVAEGSPETVARSRKSYTGQALRALLDARRQRRSA